MRAYKLSVSCINHAGRLLGSNSRVNSVIKEIRRRFSSESAQKERDIEKCFNKSMENIMRKYSPTHIVIGVSGGSDSMALAKLSSEWSNGLLHAGQKGPSLTAVVVDHTLRDTSHQESADTVKELESKLAMQVKSVKINWEDTSGKIHMPSINTLQNDARGARYDALIKACMEVGANVILIAHHRGDLAESLLMRWLRGSGVSGWLSLPSERFVFVSGVLEPYSNHAVPDQPPHVVLVRPLLFASKEDLRLICAGSSSSSPKIAWIEDASNINQKFDRVRVRTALLSLKEGGRSGESILGEAAKEASQWAQLMDETCSDVLSSSSVVIHPTGCIVIDFSKMMKIVTSTQYPEYLGLLSDAEWKSKGQCSVIVECIGRVVAVVENNHLKPSRKSIQSLLDWVWMRAQNLDSSTPSAQSRNIGDCRVSAYLGGASVQLTISRRQNVNGTKRHSNEGKELTVDFAKEPLVLNIAQNITVPRPFYHMLFRSKFWITGLIPQGAESHSGDRFISVVPIQSMRDKIENCIDRIMNEKLEQLSSQGRLSKNRRGSTKVRIRRQLVNSILPSTHVEGDSGMNLTQLQDFPVASEDQHTFLNARIRYFPSHAFRWIWWMKK